MKYIIAALLSLPIMLSGGAIKDGGAPVTLADSAGSEYVIVRPEKSDFELISAASKLSKAVEKETGTKIPVVTDKTPVKDGAYKPREIIIGKTNRGYESSSELLWEDFEISMHDNALVIYSENPDGYLDAVNYVDENFISDGAFTVPSGYSHLCRADYRFDSITLLGADIAEYSVEYETEAFKAYAESFCEQLLENTGRKCEPQVYSENEKKSIVFGQHGASDALAEYKVFSENDDIFVSARLGAGLEKAYGELTAAVFGGKGKTVNINDISTSGMLENTNEDAEYINVRTPLTNSRQKLLDGKELRVAYFGGSVTDGYGSSDFDKTSWRALSSKWLEETFPEAQITHINAAIGGSGSYLGAYRAQRDIIDQKPDLLFIEFAINDSYTPETSKTAAENYEAIVRNVRKQLPECDIVNIYVTDMSQAKSAVFVQAAAHDRVAEVYGIPSVDVGRAVAKKYGLANTQSTQWKKYFLDGVHPINAGYREFADTIIEYLSNEYIFAPVGTVTPHSLPEAVSEFADSELKFIIPDSSYLKNSKGYEFKNTGLLYLKYSSYYDYLVTSDPENSLTFTFTGSDIALFATAFNNGSFTYSVDGVEKTRTITWLNNPLILAKDLEYGEHTVTVHFDISTCKKAEIGAFLIR